jgi:hypothetical protein
MNPVSPCIFVLPAPGVAPGYYLPLVAALGQAMQAKVEVLLLGHSLGGHGALLAATALCHNLTVVTRHVKHFEPTGARAFNPFRA